MEPVNVNGASFDKVIASGKVIVDFWAPWCGPCRMLAPVLEEIASEKSDIIVAKVNVDDEQQLAVKYGISSIPAVFYFENGTLKGRSLGYMPKADLITKLGI